MVLPRRNLLDLLTAFTNTWLTFLHVSSQRRRSLGTDACRIARHQGALTLAPSGEESYRRLWQTTGWPIISRLSSL